MSDTQSYKSKLSHGSGSSTSGTGSSSTQVGFTKKIEENVFEVFLNINTGRRFFCDSLVLVILEMIFFLEVFFFMMKMCYTPSDAILALPSWYWWVYVWLDPMLLTTSLPSYMIVFLSSVVLFLLAFTLFLCVLYLRTSNDITCSFCFWFFRMTRCLFLFPLLSIFSSPLRCRFVDLSFKVYLHESDSCLAFPFLLFCALGIFCSCVEVFVAFSDTFLFLDKFRSVHIWTSCPDGRFNTMLLLCIFFMVFCDYMSFQMNFLVDVICSSCLILGILALLIVLLRFVPYYHIPFALLSGFSMTNALVLSIQRLIIVMISSSPFSLFSLIPLLITANLLFIIIVSVRYLLLFFFFKEEITQKNIFLCFFPSDISIGIFLNEEKEKVLSFLGKKKTEPSSHQKLNIQTIMSLLNNDEFDKNKALCHMMISLVIEESPTLALSILNHTKTILTDGWPDEELCLQFYRNRITNIQEVGKNGGGKKSGGKKAVLMTELERSRKREMHLNRLLLFLFKELNSEDGKVSFSRFSKLLSSIQLNQEFCENLYSRMVKSHPTPLTFRRYARYLLLYTGNQSLSNLYLKEAVQLEQIEGTLASIPRHSKSSLEKDDETMSEEERSDESDNHDVTLQSCSSEDSCFSDDKADESDNNQQETTAEEKPSLPNHSRFESLSLVKKDLMHSRSSGSLRLVVEKVSNSDDEYSDDDSRDNSIQKASYNDNNNNNNHDDRDDNDSCSYKGEGSASVFGSSIIHLDDKKGSGIRKHLYGKIEKAFYFSTLWIRLICILFLFFAVAGLVSVFAVSLIIKINFKESVVFVEKMSRLQKAIAEVRGLGRKLQTSYYPAELNPFEWERNSTAFRLIQKEHCKKIHDRALFLYEKMSKSQKVPFRSSTLNLTTHLVQAAEQEHLNEYHYEEWPLYDAVLNYADSCDQYIELPESSFMNNSAVGSRIQDDESFIFFTINQPEINAAMLSALHDLKNNEEAAANRFQWILGLIPLVLFAGFTPLFCCSYLWFCVEQRKSYKGFFFIPKDQLQKLIEKYSIEGEDEDYFAKGDGSSSKKEGQIVMDRNSDQSNDQGNIRVDTVKFSIIQQYLITIFAFMIVLVATLLIFTTLGNIICIQFVERNNEYDYTLELSTDINRNHLWATELAFRDSSLFSDDEIIQSYRQNCDDIRELFDAIRFGKHKNKYGLNGNDDKTGFFDVYYKSKCSSLTEEQKNDEIETMKCLPLSQKVEYLLHASREMMESNYSDISIRRSEYYKKIAILDNISNGTHFDDSAIEGDVLELRALVEGGLDGYFSYIENLAFVLVILYLPLFLFFYYALLKSYPTKLQRNLSTTRRIMLLMDSKVLANPNVHDFITRKSSFGKAFTREQRNRMDTVFDVLHNSSSGFICFSSEGRILRYNNAADELFRIRESGASLMCDIITKDSLVNIQKWKKRKKYRAKHSFHQEILGIYEDQEFPVLADLSTDKDGSLMIGVFENLESLKKKDFLKEAERRSGEIDALLQNILPKAIASSMKIEEFQNGKCVVYQHKKATAYFCDICNFTGMSSKTNPEDIINVLHGFYCGCDDLCEKYKLEKIKTIGDCYFCVSGIPQYKPLHAVTAMKFAIAVLKFIRIFNNTNGCKLQIRTGMSSGELVAGIVGKKKRAYDIWGPMINEAARMESHGLPGKIQVSRSTYESLFEKYEFLEREIQLQGIGVSVKAYLYTPDFSKDNDDEKKNE